MQWDEQGARQLKAEEANILLGGNAESMLLLDETSFLKKGSHSVGVTQRDHEHLGLECGFRCITETDFLR